MQLTKNRLRQIIKEELGRVLNEQDTDAMMSDLEDIQRALGTGMMAVHNGYTHDVTPRWGRNTPVEVVLELQPGEQGGILVSGTVYPDGTSASRESLSGTSLAGALEQFFNANWSPSPSLRFKGNSPKDATEEIKRVLRAGPAQISRNMGKLDNIEALEKAMAASAAIDAQPGVPPGPALPR